MKIDSRTLAESSATFIEKFALLAKRLAAMGFTVDSADLNWGSFGCWTVVVIKQKRALRFSFNGRDSFITVESATIRHNSDLDEWKELLVKEINGRQAGSISFTEDFIRDFESKEHKLKF